MIQRKIMFIGSLLDVGGAGKMLKFVANTCSTQYSDVVILSFAQDQRPIGLDERIKYLHTPTIFSEISIWSRFKMTLEIRNLVKSEEPDIVCAFISDVAVTARLATLGLGVFFVSAERGDPYTLPIIWKLLTRITYSLSDSCFFQLEKARDYYSKKTADKSFVIPNPFVLPVDVDPYYGERKKTIVSAGRFDPEKGYDVLIEAYSIVHKSHPEYRLVLYGKGPLLDSYKKIIAEYGLSDMVSFPGYISNVALGVREEGVFVLSSRYEGIPNVLIETMSVGTPIVATDCSPGGPAYLCDNGKRGIIVPLNNPEEMAKAINLLLEDNSLYKRMVNNGPKIREILDPVVISEKWLLAFNSMLRQ